jgi:hypothetical protein
MFLPQYLAKFPRVGLPNLRASGDSGCALGVSLVYFVLVIYVLAEGHHGLRVTVCEVVGQDQMAGTVSFIEVFG